MASPMPAVPIGEITQSGQSRRGDVQSRTSGLIQSSDFRSLTIRDWQIICFRQKRQSLTCSEISAGFSVSVGLISKVVNNARGGQEDNSQSEAVPQATHPRHRHLTAVKRPF
jgi:hypothetical protein